MQHRKCKQSRKNRKCHQYLCTHSEQCAMHTTSKKGRQISQLVCLCKQTLTNRFLFSSLSLAFYCGTINMLHGNTSKQAKVSGMQQYRITIFCDGDSVPQIRVEIFTYMALSQQPINELTRFFILHL